MAFLMIAIAALTVGSFFVSAFVVWSLFSWFLVPLGLPAVGYLHMCGIVLIPAMFKGASSSSASPLRDLAIRYGGAGLTYALGYVFRLYA